MTALIRPLTALFLAAAICLVGIGLVTTLLPLRADLAGFGPAAIGLMGSAYFAGFVAGCLLWPRLVSRVGHIRVFATACAAFCAVLLAFSLAVTPPFWIMLRALTGACAAGFYMVIESWLNEQSTNATRGRIFGIYLAVNFTALMLGQALLNLWGPFEDGPFVIAGMLAALALVPVALTRTREPRPVPAVTLRILPLYRLSPVGVAGCFLVGLTNSCFWTLAPVVLQGHGHGTAAISAFMAATILGGALAQWPAGRLSDRIDRRLVLLGTCLGTACVAALLAQGLGERGPVFLALAGLALGATALTGYSLCIAHVNDLVRQGEFVAVSSSLLLLFGIGSAVGPVLAGLMGLVTGRHAPFHLMAASALALALFVALRIMMRGAPPPEERASFVPLTRTSPALFHLDPRAEGGEPPAGGTRPAGPETRPET